jgi:hypothetical protein
MNINSKIHRPVGQMLADVMADLHHMKSRVWRYTDDPEAEKALVDFVNRMECAVVGARVASERALMWEDEEKAKAEGKAKRAAKPKAPKKESAKAATAKPRKSRKAANGVATELLQ